MKRWMVDFIPPLIASMGGFGVGTYLALPTGQQLLLTIISFVIPLIIQNAIHLRSLLEVATVESRRLRMKTQADIKLISIQNSFHRIVESSAGDEALFCEFYQNEFATLEEHIRDADEKGQLRMEAAHYYMTPAVLSLFDLPDTNWFKDVFIISDINDIFDTHSLNYFNGLIRKLREKKLVSIESLFVITGEIIADDNPLDLLLRFYHRENGMDYRIIDQAIYYELFRDSRLPEEYVDFGIYGQRVMFRTITYEPTTTGVFTRNRDAIEKYKRFFENCWNSPSAYKINHNGASEIDIKDIVGGSPILRGEQEE